MVKRIVFVLALVVALSGCNAQQAQIWWALKGGGQLPADKAQVFADIYNGACAPDYFPCLPQTSDVDCAAGSGNGPAYTAPGQRYIMLTPGSDPYELDADHDGVGCE
jgi:uncharacterized lipoprotein NlpE involved in copper resistance